MVARKIFQAVIEYGQSKTISLPSIVFSKGLRLTSLASCYASERCSHPLHCRSYNLRGLAVAKTETLGLYQNDQGFIPLTSAPLIDDQFFWSYRAENFAASTRESFERAPISDL
jgi:hypothetical protein